MTTVALLLSSGSTSMSLSFLSRFMAQRSSREMLLVFGGFEFLRTLQISALISPLSSDGNLVMPCSTEVRISFIGTSFGVTANFILFRSREISWPSSFLVEAFTTHLLLILFWHASSGRCNFRWCRSRMVVSIRRLVSVIAVNRVSYSSLVLAYLICSLLTSMAVLIFLSLLWHPLIIKRRKAQPARRETSLALGWEIGGLIWRNLGKRLISLLWWQKRRCSLYRTCFKLFLSRDLANCSV